MMQALAIFPVDEATQRPDGRFDFIGAVWDYRTVASFPWEGETRVAILVRRAAEDRVPRHQLKIFGGLPQPGVEPIYTEALPGLSSGDRNGCVVLSIPMRLETPGPVVISAQVDDTPPVSTEFDLRLG